MKTEDGTDLVYQTMVRCIETYNMLEAETPVIACVSGGCDSVAMLLLLERYGKEYGHPIFCAHFNHLLRGEESDADCLFVRDLCLQRGIPFYSDAADVNRFAAKKGLSLEDAARSCRYAYFEELATRFNAKIAVAHNKNDKTETVLLNLARGTGIHGLRGIPYVRDRIIRPLLDVSRQELERVCAFYGIAFRTDRTNLQPLYKRNRIRLSVLPFLRDNLDAEIDEKLYRLSLLAADEDSFLQEEAEKRFRDLWHAAEGVAEIKDRHRYAEMPAALRRRVCGILLSAFQTADGRTLFPNGRGISYSVIERMDGFLVNGAVGDSVELARGLRGRIYHDGTRLYVFSETEMKEGTETGALDSKILPCDYEAILSLCRRNGEQMAAFDYEKLTAYCAEKKSQPVFRTRSAGDYFTPYGAEGGKRLKKFFIDAKVPADRRNAIPLLACGNEILWIFGVRRSNIAPIDKNTLTAIIFSAKHSI